MTDETRNTKNRMAKCEGAQGSGMLTFSKYHGCGNNFVIMREKEVIDALTLHGMDSSQRIAEYSQLAKEMCQVNSGVGADGMIIVREVPQLEMVFFNCDGSRAPMCGNGIRCFAHFCQHQEICRETVYSVKTLAGDMVVEVTDQQPFSVRIDMGRPVFSPKTIGVDLEQENFLNQQLTLEDGRMIPVDSFFMGTIHTVVMTAEAGVSPDDLQAIEALGKEICNHPVFQEKTNVNFVTIIDEKTLEVRTYERGVGMTLACGTGACASVVAAHMQGLCGSKTEVRLPLGSLKISLGNRGSVYMEGPSERILTGVFYRKGEK